MDKVILKNIITIQMVTLVITRIIIQGSRLVSGIAWGRRSGNLRPREGARTREMLAVFT